VGAGVRGEVGGAGEVGELQRASAAALRSAISG